MTSNPDNRESKVTDFLQGVRNCPPTIIPMACGACPIMDRRSESFGFNPLKPRCPEPNFLGTTVIQGLNDTTFDHENIRPALYWNLVLAPPYFCICQNAWFKIEFRQINKFYYPIVILRCRCGREKKIILLTGNLNLAHPWLNEKLAKKHRAGAPMADAESALGKTMQCSCGGKHLCFYFSRDGFEFYPREGATMLLGCKKCKKSKRVYVSFIDDTEPWLSKDGTIKPEDVIVRSRIEECPDSRSKDENEKVIVIPLSKIS